MPDSSDDSPADSVSSECCAANCSFWSSVRCLLWSLFSNDNEIWDLVRISLAFEALPRDLFLWASEYYSY